ncbi:hypothetical protein PS918_02410 [Pseudomonas fluorescens]|uniref:Uncharacterized protein n=1 Tax=Pseudomonas fluorescens TaxID=294 RepID=A0A5E7S6C4_PSEFL|nr:hypothetical protein PS918_02410 [Pseudomonas fluorescens]
MELSNWVERRSAGVTTTGCRLERSVHVKNLEPLLGALA